MYLMLTEHYKKVNRFPVDIGGLTFHEGPKGGIGIPKEVDDHLGNLLAKANFPIAVPCTREGKALVAVPAIPVAKVEVAPVVKAETKSIADETAATEADAEVPGTPEGQPMVEEVETPAAKKARLKAEKAALKAQEAAVDAEIEKE